MENRVYELRKKKGWSLTQLSMKSGVGKTAINNFENGKTEHPTMETITCLAQALGVSINELFEEKKPKHITAKNSDFPELTKKEYIAELQNILSEIETYKVRYFYIFTMAKLGIKPKDNAGDK